jgi:tripartite ATP-independent transporter DctM subunit
MIDASLVLLILMLAGIAAGLMLGYPVAFTLAGVSLLVAFVGLGLEFGLGVPVGTLDLRTIELFPERIFGTMTNEVLLAVPLFIAMGLMLEKSRVAEDLLETLGLLFGRVPGGLGISITVVGALMAASTGIVGATVVTMGLLSLPTMLRRGYDPKLAAGSIAAAGTLGQIIPPSIVLVLLGDVLSTAFQRAQRDLGNFTPDTVTVGDLFAGAVLPGVLLVVLYVLYQAAVAFFRPQACPALQGPRQVFDWAFLKRLVLALLVPVSLLLGVLGSILFGVATPTEAASIGAVGAILLAGVRLSNTSRGWILAGAVALAGLLVLSANNDFAYQGEASLVLLVPFVAGLALSLRAMVKTGVLKQALEGTVKMTVMVFAILLAAGLFALVFRGLDGDIYIAQFLTGLPGGATGATIVVMATMFFLGFFLDFIEIVFVVVPIVAPVLFMMGVDPVWLGVMMAVNLQTSFLTPPFGFALFYLRGVAPPAIKTEDIYRGVVPFIAIQILALVALAAFPALATWLPEFVFGH